MALDIVGQAGVDIVPVVPQFHEKAKAQLLPIADRLGIEIGRIIGERIGDNIRITLPSAVQDGGRRAAVAATREGEQAGGAFARSMKAKLEAAFKAMPKLDIRLSDTGVDAELARLRAKLQQLSAKRIGIDIDAETAALRVAELDAELRRLGANHPNPTVRIDTATARAALAEVAAEIEAITRDPHEIEIRPGQFREQLVARIRAATAALPVVDVDVSTDASEIKLTRLRAELAAIPERLETDVHFTDADALAALARLRAELTALNAEGVRIDVRADAAAAEAELASVAAAVTALDAQRAEIKVDTSGATSAVFTLALQIGALAAIGGLPVVAAGIGAIASAAVAAGAGVGALALVAIPAVMGVAKAMQAKKAATDQAANATAAGANADVTATQRALSLAGAQQSLTSAKRSAAQQIENANRSVAQSEQALADATEKSVADREQAQQRVADAVAAAADAQTRAARQVADAERSLADAQRAEQQAQTDLTDARKSAADQLAALSDRLADGALDERTAALRVTRAEQELQAVRLAGVGATRLQRDEAQLSYDQALQAQREQHESYAKLQADAKAASAAGVDGADVVVQAQDKLTKAQRTTADQAQAVADAQESAAKSAASSARAVADAQTAAAKTAASSARSVADAQERVAEAQKSAAAAQVTAAESVASAQRGVQQAMLSTEKSVGSATTAASKYEDALSKLSPSARRLFDAIAGPGGLNEAFKAWTDEMAPDVLPLLVRGVDGAKASLPGLTPLVEGAARAIGTLMDKASAELKSPFWQGFKADIQTIAEPAITGLGVAFGNVVKGMGGVVDAFLPHMAGISETLQHVTDRFADWGAGLKGSPQFEKFLDYASSVGPHLAEALGKIADALLSIGKGLSPLTSAAFDGVGWVAEKVSMLATDYPGLIQALWVGLAVWKVARLVAIGAAAGVGLYATATGIATAETGLFAAAVQTTGIVPIIELIVIAIAALVLGVIYAYNHWTWFRVAVTATWEAIKVAALFVWNYVLKPAFDGIWAAIQFVGAAAVWLWENAIGPAFRFIWEAAKVLFAIVVTAVIAPIIITFNILSAVAMWLWKEVMKPVFDGIGIIAMFLWKWIFLPFGEAIVATFKGIADVGMWLWKYILQPAFEGIGAGATWLWKNAIKPAFDGISAAAGWLWEHALKPAFDKISEALTPLGQAFDKAKDLIGKAWDQLVDITKKPVNFLIDAVYNNGIKAVWDKVADFVKLPHLPEGPKLLAAGGTIGNGWGPAIPMVTNRPTAIVGEGNPNYPEYVIPTDPKFRSRALALHQAAGSQLMADGGIIGDIWGGIKGAAGSAWDFAKDGADLLTDPSRIWDKLSQPIRDLFAKIGDSAMAKTVIGMPTKMLGGLKDKLVDFIGIGGGSQGGNGGTGVQRWAPTVLQALGVLGQPASWLDTVLRRMNQESGGNPDIVNMWDSNWQAGTPSVGLMQVIGPTFKAYAEEFKNTGPMKFGTSTDPLANIFAGLNYAQHRYGSLSALNRPGGYDEGGYLPTGTSLVYNHTGRPEPVFTTGQWDAIRSGGLGGSGDVHLDAHVYVGDREITDIVRVEVTRSNSLTAQALTAGRRN